MELDTNYTHIDICPETGEQLNDDEVYYSEGVCPKCGHVDNSTITHYKQVVGRWNRPSFFEKWFKGKKIEFLRKEDEDKVWGKLKNEH